MSDTEEKLVARDAERAWQAGGFDYDPDFVVFAAGFRAARGLEYAPGARIDWESVRLTESEADALVGYADKGMVKEAQKVVAGREQGQSVTKKDDLVAPVIQIAQAVLTGLNVGDVQSGSAIHKKLREVMIAYREAKANE